MASLTQTQLLKDLQTELADIELQQNNKTLSHSDQQMLDQAWNDIMNQMDALQESYEAWQAYIDRRGNEWNEWYDAAEYYEEEDDEEPPQRTVTVAPPPPSVTVPSGWTRDGTIVAQMPSGQWLPAPLPLRIRTPPSTEEDDEEDLQRAYELEDDRPDCSRCAGCAYCEESSAYDGTEEV